MTKRLVGLMLSIGVFLLGMPTIATFAKLGTTMTKTATHFVRVPKMSVATAKIKLTKNRK
jgi:hypothetical protein